MKPDRLEAGALALLAPSVVIVTSKLARDPVGWFGSFSQLNHLGVALGLVLSFLAATSGVLHVLQWPGQGILSVVAFGGLAGLALPVAVEDPAVGLPALGWISWVAFRLLFPERGRFPGKAKTLPLAEAARRAELSVSLVSLVLVLLVVGYRLTQDAWGVWAVFGAVVVSAALSTWADFPSLSWKYVRSKRTWVPWLAAVLVAVLAGASLRSLTIALAARQLLIVVEHLGDAASKRRWLDYLFSRPAQMFVLSFVVVIALGGLLLSFPVASASGESLPPVDALFTATSAVCVTGLVTLDTATQFSHVGQAIILGLIQLGGLGVITLSSFAALLLSRRLGLRHEGALEVLTDQPSPRQIGHMLKFIVLSTFAIEALGVPVLWWGFSSYTTTGDALWKALFHSISAFCNAGFALQSDSLMPFQHSPLILLTVSILIVTGALGFPVLEAIGRRVLKGARLTMYPKIAIVASALLIAVGFVLVLMVEWSHALGHLSPGDKVMNALFQSITLRTAGFNAVDMTSFRPATVAMMIAWMFVGGGSGSTAGGVKVTTISVLVLYIVALLKGRDQVEVFHRTIPHAIVERAAIVTMLGMSFVVVGHFLLLMTQTGTFEKLLFETVSAMGTVGLSLDVTGTLDGFGKAVIMVLMLAGRVGPLTLLLTMRNERKTHVRFPSENIPVG